MTTPLIAACPFRLLGISGILAAHLFLHASLHAEPEGSQETADRYEQMLLRSPEPGTAFDKVVDWYASSTGLPSLQQRWKENSDPVQRRSLLILQGLLAQRQGRPAEARRYFQEALNLEGEKSLAAKPLAALEATEGNFSAAAAAYTAALSSESLSPPQRLDLMRSLALLHQRAFDAEKAVAVWRDAVAQFPDDTYVQEEAGEAFLAAGSYEEARKCFTRQRDLTSDPFQKIAASLRMARTLELEGKIADAQAIYESALEETAVGSWINREVRGQVEALFRRKDDLPGLLAFYEKRMKTTPQDYATLVAQSKVLEELGRSDEAIASARQAANLAPGEASLRLGLVRLLAANERPEEALAELTELAKSPSASAEILILSGNLQWAIHEKKRDDAFRAAALAAWNRLAPPESQDPARIGQLAEILASKGLGDEAFAQWQRLSALAPELPEPRQRLAEIYLKKSDPDSAAKILAGLAEGPLAQASNFVTLARIQERLELGNLARETTTRGLALFPDNYDLLRLAWRQSSEARDVDAAARLYPLLWRQASGDFAAGEAEKGYADLLESTGKAPAAITDLLAALKAGTIEPSQTALLFRFAILRNDEATARLALEKIRGGDTALRAARVGLEFAKAFGSVDDQIAAQQAVATADPRLAAESLRAAARLLADSGRADAALEILGQLLEKSPADVSLYTLYSDLASRTGKFADAVRQLNRGIRQVDNATTLRLQLATLLDAQGQSGEALKVIQEAFENETSDARRLEVFRRQVEAAQRAGKLDDLIAHLREKQLREQNGARYGVYLAEIYLAQDDYLAARDELTRSLGRSPDNPAALARLIDLAERGGDRDESLRLAQRLAEVAPSAANRAALLTRLLEAGETAAGLQELAQVRSEIIKDPKTWSSALSALQRVGLAEEFNALIEEIVASAGTGIVPQAEMARLRLQQQDVEAAEKILWSILESGNLAEAAKAVSEDIPSQYAGNFRDRRFAFQFLSSEIMNSFSQLFGSSQSHFSMQGVPRGSGKATAEQREIVSSVLLLSMLADARNEDEAFARRLRKLLADRGEPRSTRLMLLESVNDRTGMAELVREQAEDPRPDRETDRLLSTVNTDPLWEKNLKTIRERLAKADPAAEFEQAFEKAAKELSAKAEKGDIPVKEYRRLAETLSRHPGFSASPGAAARLAIWAAQGGDFALAFRLCDEESAGKGDPKIPPQHRVLAAQNARAMVVARAIAAHDPRAAEELEKVLQMAGGQPAASPIYFSPFGMRIAPGNAALAQSSPDLVAGVAAFPLPIFRSLFAFPAGAADNAKIQKWFASHASDSDLTVPTLGAIYADWFLGRREAAWKRLEAVHAKNPSPDSAALLLEVCEKLEKPDQALALLEAAALQPDETGEIRNLRKIRLLRAAGKKEEAAALAERTARGRVSQNIREHLANELNLLGLPQDSYKNLTVNSFTRFSQPKDRSEPVRLQVSKLIADKQPEEAERIATQFLARPLPSRQDYRGINARQNMISLLSSMGRIEGYRQTLQDRLDKNPSDLEAAVRLAEARMNDRSAEGLAKLCEFLQAHPERHAAMPFALHFLMRSGNNPQQSAQAVAAMLRADPDLFSTGGLQIHDLQNFLSSPQSAPVFAEAFAAMDDNTFNRIFRAARLTNNTNEFAIVNRLAEVSAAEGKIDQAIVLLSRLRPTAEKNLDTGLLSILTLAELQLEKGDLAGAAETIKSLIGLRGSRRFGYGGGATSLQNLFANSAFNPQNWKASSELFRRLFQVAESTGTYDALLASFDQQQFGYPALSSSLILRTALEKPGIEKEWRKIALGEGPAGPIPPVLLPLALKALSQEKDAAKLLPALLAKAGGSGSSHYALYTVTEIVPLLGKFRSDPAVAKFISSQVNLAMSDPNSSGYLLFSDVYPGSILALLDGGFDEEARTLFDFTAAQRGSGRFGRRTELDEVERRFQNTSERVTAITAAVTALPSNTPRKTVRWRFLPLPRPSENRTSEPSVAWTDPEPALPKALRPATLEIFAGPNPAALERVGKKANPALSGSLEVTVPGEIGLFHARWELPDGSTGTGPLQVYLTGDNLIRDNGVPEAKSSRAANAFKRDQPGPGGQKSAVLFESVSASSQLAMPLMNIPWDDKNANLAFVGWFGTAREQTSAPTLDVQLLFEDGRLEKRGSGYMPMAPGQWHQAFVQWTGSSAAGGNTIPATVKQLNLGIEFQANRGLNGQYPIAGLWDNLQIVRLKKGEDTTNASPSLQAFREALGKKDYAAAATAYLATLRVNPSAALQQSPAPILEAFKKSGRLPELYAQAGAPALLLPNPLRYKNPTLNNPGFLGALTAEALDPGAPPAAKSWLASLDNAPLSEEMRFVVQAGRLTESAKRHPEQVKAAEILSVLGFDAKGLNENRLRMLWYFRIPGKPTPAILELFANETLAAEAAAQVSALEIPANLQASRLMLQAWLAAPVDPAKALELANQAQAQPGQTSISFDETSQRALLLRIARKHTQPGTLVAALKTWLAKSRPDGREQDRKIVEFLHDASVEDSPGREEFAALWADAELAALKTPGYNGSRDRVRALALRLLELSDWNRLDDLLTTSLASKTLSDDALRKEFAQLRNIVDFSRGKTDLAWPVVWGKPGTGSRDVTLEWQWNIRDINHDRNDFDTAVSIAPKPLLPEISGQLAVEIFFGEMPTEMTLLAKSDGSAAQGSLAATLPASNGFLRAVAVFDGRRHPGPLTPVISGRRIYPPDNTSLRDMLTSGSEPVNPALLTPSGEAPDGSPALRLGSPTERQKLNYHGPDFPVTPGKFYVSRSWMRRAGAGSGTVSSKFSPVKTSKQGTLDMLLSEGMEATGQWVLYTRAVPAVNQHTFWIPMDEIATMSPRFWDVAAGTELAAFELREISDWKYGQWIVDLATLRQNAGHPPDDATLDRAFALASLEPLTAMDYHGDWLARTLTAAGRSGQFLQLARTALTAEANPLFSRPKLPRIFDYLLGVLHRGEGPDEFRRELAALLLSSPARTSAMQRTAALAYAIALAAPEKRGETARAASQELAEKMGDPAAGPAHLKALITARSGRGDRPANELLYLLVALQDAEISALFLKEIQGKSGESLPANDRIFATIALEAASPSAGANPDWSSQVERAFQATENLDSPDAYMRWPFVLADFLTARHLAPEVVANLRKNSLRRVLAAKPEHNGRTAEAIRAAAFLIEHTLAQKGDAHETVETIIPLVQAGSQTISEGSVRLLLHASKLLAGSGADADAAALAKAAEPALIRFPKLSAEFSALLPKS